MPRPRDEPVFGDHLALAGTCHDRQRPVRLDMQAHLLADEPDRHPRAVVQLQNAEPADDQR
jgi:hypothetical protein